MTDADADVVTMYQFYDATPGNGHFVINGVVQGDGQIEVIAAQLAQTQFQAGAGMEDLYVRAFDGLNWSSDNGVGWTHFHTNGPVNHAPTVTASEVSTTRGQLLDASSLFSLNDADGDAMTMYQFYDATPGNGHFVINGVVQGDGQIEVTAAQLAQTQFQAGAGMEDFYVRAFDGLSWSSDNGAGWTHFHTTGPVNHAPTVTASEVSTTRGQLLNASSLFSLNDADGDAMTMYQFYDATPGTGISSSTASSKATGRSR